MLRYRIGDQPKKVNETEAIENTKLTGGTEVPRRWNHAPAIAWKSYESPTRPSLD